MIKDEKQVNELYEQAKATMELEGFVFTEEDEKVIKEVISGRKPFHELIRELKKE